MGALPQRCNRAAAGLDYRTNERLDDDLCGVVPGRIDAIARRRGWNTTRINEATNDEGGRSAASLQSYGKRWKHEMTKRNE